MKRTGVISRQLIATPTVAPVEYDLVIRNGIIFDGLRTPRFVSDIGIKNGKTATIGRISKDAVAKKTIDATGKHVCPGFIDLHTHYDAQIFWDPYCTLSGWHGVTSVVIGNCGFGYAPCQPEMRSRAMKTMERTEAVPYEAQEKGMPWDWVTFPEFLDSLDRTPKGINVCSFVGLAPLMTYVMGVENAKGRPATGDEMAEMKRLLKEGMEAGAAGFGVQMLGETSVQRDFDGTPMVTDTMAKEDLYQFGSVLAELGRGSIQCAGPSQKTTENLAKASGRPVIYNAIAPEADQHGQPKGNHAVMCKWLEDCNKKGLRVLGQAIVSSGGDQVALRFTLDTFNLFDASPPWRNITLGDVDERIRRMQDPKMRQACRTQFDNPEKTVAQLVADDSKFDTKEADGGLGLSLRKLILNKCYKDENKQYVGMQLMDIAAARDAHIVDTFLDISISENLINEWGQSAKMTNTSALKDIATSPYTVPGLSDGGAHTKFITLGDWTTDFLQNLVRENDMMSFEEAHWRLSKYCADAGGMHDRGTISVGMPADIIVYDAKTLRSLPEEVQYDFPGGEWRRTKRAEGYEYTIVNGEITFEGNRCTGATPGRLLRHGRAQDMM